MINTLSKSVALREPFSGLSHLVGAILAAVAMVAMLVQAPEQNRWLYLASYVTFGLTMLFMFLSSAVYHLFTASEATITRLKCIDHIAIYLMIAGSYTPYLLLGLDASTSYAMLGIIWSLALLGALKKLFWLNAPRWFSTLLYLGMGWLSAFIYQPLSENLSPAALSWLLAGGIIYSIGALVYGLKWPNLNRHFGFHELWHVFVLGGATCHTISIALYL